MANIVLVHGGWHGGWVWKEVAHILCERGHNVFTPTMTGLGERAHLAHPDITPTTHVKDVVGVLEWNELENVVLVGHSYGGFIITGAAAQCPDRIASLVYLDAFVPTESGQSAFSIDSPERRRQIEGSMTEGYLVPPTGFENWSRHPDKIEWLKKMATPHPIRCFSEGPQLTGAEKRIGKKVYLWCSDHDSPQFRQFYEKYRDDPEWVTEDLPCLHDAMVDEPKLVSDHVEGAITT